MNSMNSTKKKKPSNRLIVGLVYVGFLLLLFSFGKGFIDLLNPPENTIDLAADDEINSGFLPVYAGQGDTADAEVQTVADAGGQSVPGQAFPTPAPDETQLQPTREPGLQPDRLAIDVIDLEAEIQPVEFAEYEYQGEFYQQWLAPEHRAVGWHITSAGLGVPGNTVLNGHHNIRGEVFRDLYQVQVGDQIKLYSGDQEFQYVIVYTDVLPERNQTLDIRLANAEWILPTEDERVTLITCWPYESNTHRVVVVAVPVRSDSSG